MHTFSAVPTPPLALERRCVVCGSSLAGMQATARCCRKPECRRQVNAYLKRLSYARNRETILARLKAEPERRRAALRRRLERENKRCLDCGKPISLEATRCPPCANMARQVRGRLER